MLISELFDGLWERMRSTLLYLYLRNLAGETVGVDFLIFPINSDDQVSRESVRAQ